jgi:hypothetical protein
MKERTIKNYGYFLRLYFLGKKMQNTGGTPPVCLAILIRVRVKHTAEENLYNYLVVGASVVSAVCCIIRTFYVFLTFFLNLCLNDVKYHLIFSLVLMRVRDCLRE